jgi:ABC-type multidrug transport system fused ATPase/permease subunit
MIWCIIKETLKYFIYMVLVIIGYSFLLFASLFLSMWINILVNGNAYTNPVIMVLTWLLLFMFMCSMTIAILDCRKRKMNKKGRRKNLRRIEDL